MARNPSASDLQDKFLLRLPDGLRDRIAAAAKANGRSMNSEINAVLEEHYPPPTAFDDVIESIRLMSHDRDRLDAIRAMIDDLSKQLTPKP